MRRTLFYLTAICFILVLYQPVHASLRNIETTGVVISDSSMELIIGTTEELRAWVQPEDATNKNIYWVSSDNEVVTVRSKGLSSAEIRAEGGGEAWVTVITEDNDWRASCKVTVVIPVSRVYMELTELSLESGEEYQFEAFLSPETATNRQLEWASSNNQVIQVDEKGLAEAISPGTARIVARSEEDDNLYAFCTVTVNGEAVDDEHENITEVIDETEKNDAIDENQIEPADSNIEEAAEHDETTGKAINYLYFVVGAVIILLVTLIIIVQRKRHPG